MNDEPSSHVCSLELLVEIIQAVNWSSQYQRNELYEKLCKFKKWQGPLPYLRGIFRRKEIDWLLVRSVQSRCTPKADLLLDFAIKCQYKDEPELDEKGSPSSVRTTPVHYAASSSFLSICQGRTGSEPLRYQMSYRRQAKINPEAVRDVLEIVDDLFRIYDRFDVNYTDDGGFTHLHAACKAGSHEVVKKLLNSGHDPNCIATNELDVTPLHAALQWGHERLAQMLLKAGANPNIADHVNRSTPLHVVCARGELINEGKVTDEFVTGAITIILDDSDKKYLPVQINAKDALGWTPLQLALHWDCKSAAELLLNRGADFNIANERGESPLHQICQKFNEDNFVSSFLRLSLALQRTVRINAADAKGSTPLHLAVTRGRAATMETLLRHGADPNIANNDGETPLHLMTEQFEDRGLFNRFVCICDELKAPLTLDAKNWRGWSPLQLATSRGHKYIIETLLKRGSNPNTANNSKETPLHTICRRKFEDRSLIELFFQINKDQSNLVNIDALDSAGRTAYHLANDNGYKQLMEILVEEGADLSIIDPLISYTKFLEE